MPLEWLLRWATCAPANVSAPRGHQPEHVPGAWNMLEPEDVSDCPVRSVVIKLKAASAADGLAGCLRPEMLRADIGPLHYLPVVMVLSARTKCCA